MAAYTSGTDLSRSGVAERIAAVTEESMLLAQHPGSQKSACKDVERVDGRSVFDDSLDGRDILHCGRVHVELLIDQ